MKKLEAVVEYIVLGSRWLLVVFYLGLALALAMYGFTFLIKLKKLFLEMGTMEETDGILRILSLIDASLVASLVVMVIISGYENFVSKLDGGKQVELNWLGKIDVSSLKVKVASTIVAISSIHLLQVFLNSDTYTGEKMMWLTIMHMAFVVSALMLAFIDRVMPSHD
ncbi:TIGR00645 family protein [Aestuariivirga litoralis]|uniref:TIGR00645 family protein n=1 Tax=Aestuariivirga litoralis TaxID=2650924 RepID=UPI0018C7D60D|nr:TIGR00645 family protein [Aestuariivirga litoralis]MBG1233605.1 TIGR00645 family protein [Aestuariivirga litoralis]